MGVVDAPRVTEEPEGNGLSSWGEARARVFAAVLTKGPLSRRDIARLTGLSQSTITKAVKPLLEAGYVVEEPTDARGPGRPAVPLRVSGNRHYVVGVKIAPHEAIGVVTSPNAEVLGSARVALPSAGVDDVVQTVAGLVSELRASRAEYAEHVDALGVALGGHVDGRIGVLRYSPIFGWRDVPLAELLRAATGLPTVVENDVNALAVAEQLFDAGRDVASFAVVTVGAGVGCGFVVDHELVHGSSGMAGEIGHVVVDPEGEACRCGNRGCLETIAADGAILAAIRRSGGPALNNVGEAAVLARQGDEAAREAFSRAGTMLGRAIATLVNILDPSLVVLSGEGVAASDLLMDSLREELAARTFAEAEPELVTRPLGDEMWARGAAANVLRHLISGPLAQASTVPLSRR